MDLFKTISAPSQGIYKEKMSKFIAFALPVESVEQAKATIKRIANEYHDARHCCWAYMIGTNRDVFLSSDNGEPSGTAGKPILGQINSFELTNIVIAVVRYFGGIKLGTSGLIEAYRQAAREAILAAHIIESHEQATLSFSFDYLAMNHVMRIIKSNNITIISQEFNNTCSITIRCDADLMPIVKDKLSSFITYHDS